MIKIITIDVPFPDNSGGRQITLGRIMSLVKEYGQVEVVSFNYKMDSTHEAKQFFKENRIEFNVFTPEKSSLIKIAFLSILLIESRQSLFVKKTGFMRYLSEINFFSSADEVWIDSIFLVPALSKSIKNNKKINKWVICFHNVESIFLRSMVLTNKHVWKKVVSFIDAAMCMILEKKIGNLSEDEGVFFNFLSGNDRDYYIDYYNYRKELTVLNNNYIHIIEERKTRDIDINNPFFLFPGSLNFPPNRQAMLAIAKIYQDSTSEVPIIVTGMIDQEIKDEFAVFNKIKFTGRISKQELYSKYASCICVISPILSGGGVKVKNLETLQLGVPLLLTEFSNIGIYDSELKSVVRNDPCDFVNQMLVLVGQQ